MQFSRVSLRCAQPSYTSCFNFKEWVLYLYMELESQASALRHIAWACWIYISPKMPGKQYAHPSILWSVSGSEVYTRDGLLLSSGTDFIQSSMKGAAGRRAPSRVPPYPRDGLPFG